MEKWIMQEKISFSAFVIVMSLFLEFYLQSTINSHDIIFVYTNVRAVECSIYVYYNQNSFKYRSFSFRVFF